MAELGSMPIEVFAKCSKLPFASRCSSAYDIGLAGRYSDPLNKFADVSTMPIDVACGRWRDVTLEELRIECCFPEDEATANFCRELVGIS